MKAFLKWFFRRWLYAMLMWNAYFTLVVAIIALLSGGIPEMSEGIGKLLLIEGAMAFYSLLYALLAEGGSADPEGLAGGGDGGGE